MRNCTKTLFRFLGVDLKTWFCFKSRPPLSPLSYSANKICHLKGSLMFIACPTQTCAWVINDVNNSSVPASLSAFGDRAACSALSRLEFAPLVWALRRVWTHPAYRRACLSVNSSRVWWETDAWDCCTGVKCLDLFLSVNAPKCIDIVAWYFNVKSLHASSENRCFFKRKNFCT